MNEIYKDIKGYEGLYQVSNYGNVRSLDRVVECSNGQRRRYKGMQLALAIDGHGYSRVSLYNEGVRNSTTVHPIVWNIFGDRSEYPRDMEIDHIDHNKNNNNIENLRLISHRENCSRAKARYEKLSKYTGVTFDKSIGKFKSSIRFKGTYHYLGIFDNEEDAHKEYQEQLGNIKEKSIVISKKRKKLSKYKGVTKYTKSNRWVAFFKRKYLGHFDTEEEAYFAYQEKKQECLNLCM